MAVFVSPKRDFRSDGDQVEHRNVLKYKIKKPPKGFENPLRGLTRSSSGNPTFSFLTPEWFSGTLLTSLSSFDKCKSERL
jgi:hypothetical protein